MQRRVERIQAQQPESHCRVARVRFGGITRDVLQSGRHVFCEKCLVFKPAEVHGLRSLAEEHPKQILQTGLQRRYSGFYQTVKQMVDKGILGNVHHIHAQ